MKSSLILTTLLLLLAAFFRLWQFDSAPPGLQHDELFKAQEGRAIVESGDWRLFYPSNQGHEGAYVWLNGLSYALFGANRVMVKMPALWCGLIALALLYQVAATLFNRKVAWLAMGLGAVCFWMVFTNRVGLRANLLPPVTLGVIWGLWRVGFYRPNEQERRWGWATLTGVCLGFAIYTYTASFTLYLAYGVFLLALILWQRAIFQKRLYEWALITIIGVVLTLPMLQIRLNDPQGQNRANTINMPYTEFKAGNPDPILQNAVKLITMPVDGGDPEWRYNVAGRPLFWLPIGILVYAGFGIVLARAKNPLKAMLVALAILGLIPSLVTIAAPSYLRSIITAPSLLIFIAVGLEGITQGISQPSRVQVGVTRWSPFFRSSLLYVILGIGMIGITAWRDGHAYFEEWPTQPEVQAIYRDDLEQLALSVRQADTPMVFATTVEPNFLDPAIYEFSNASQETQVVWFNGVTNMILGQQPTLLYVSPLSPISPAHQIWLSEEYGTNYLGPLYRQDDQIAFDIYQLGNPSTLRDERLQATSQFPIYLPPPPPFPSDQLLDWAQPATFPINFGDLIQLVGVEMPSYQIPNQDNGVDNGLQLQLYLQPLQSQVAEPLSLFVQFIAWDGSPFAGRDFIGVPPLHWQADMIFVQDHYVGNFNLEPRPYFVSLGLYNTLTGQRYPILDDQGNILGDNILLGQLELVRP